MPDRPVSSLAARTCRGVLLAAFATVLTACAPHRTFEDEVFSANRAVRDAVSMRTFSTDEPIELKTSGALAVDVDNFAGDVTIRADRKVDRTYVEVRRVATHGLGRWIESKDAPSTLKFPTLFENLLLATLIMLCARLFFSGVNVTE